MTPMPTQQPLPTPPDNKRDSAAQAQYLADLIQASIGVELSGETIRAVRQHLNRVGADNYEDLIAAIFLECWQEYKATGPLADDAVRRAADRVRQRLIRSTRRESPTATPEFTPYGNLPPDEEVSLVLHEFQVFLARRSPEEALLFQRYYLDNVRDANVLAAEMNTSPATIYRRLKTIREDFLAHRDFRDPPHGVG
jgi:hypothetical protein